MESLVDSNENLESKNADSGTPVGVGFFFRRFLALMIDGIVIMGVWACVVFLASFFLKTALVEFRLPDKYIVFYMTPLRTFGVLMMALGQMFLWTYMTSSLGATPGKYLLGLKIVSNETNQLLKFWPAFLRVNIFGYIVLLFGYVVPLSSLYDEKRRHWIDFILKTRVIRTTGGVPKAKKRPILASILIVFFGIASLTSISRNAESISVLFNPKSWKGSSQWIFHRDGIQVQSDQEEVTLTPENQESDESGDAGEGEIESQGETAGEEAEQEGLKRYMNFSLSPTEKKKVAECLPNDLGLTPEMQNAACRCYVINYDPESMDGDSEAALVVRNELLEMCKNDVMTWSAEAEKGL